MKKGKNIQLIGVLLITVLLTICTAQADNFTAMRELSATESAIGETITVTLTLTATEDNVQAPVVGEVLPTNFLISGTNFNVDIIEHKASTLEWVLWNHSLNTGDTMVVTYDMKIPATPTQDYNFNGVSSVYGSPTIGIGGNDVLTVKRFEGDVTATGLPITGGDAQLVAQHIVHAIQLTGEDAQAADVNDNQDNGNTPSITGIDLQLIKQFVVHSITEFPGGEFIP